jgi:ribosomal small subunit protein bTHX
VPSAPLPTQLRRLPGCAKPKERVPVGVAEPVPVDLRAPPAGDATFFSDPQENSGMGKGDHRTRRGKIYQGSFGKTRPKSPDKKKPAKK